MKTILLLTGLLFLSAGAVMAQSASPQAARSTKYLLFPNYDADMANLKKASVSGHEGKPKVTGSVRESIFTNYKPQLQTVRPAGSLNARKAPAGVKLTSEMTQEELDKQREPAAKPAPTVNIPTQTSQATKQ
ncbi:hypothetical protein EGT74_22070 [Chitinophaga lutea]|uniref:DUF4148 domain-containing protein n=1 Tax=Chitinophaga lutea TaxID=2488634 RepID=A0A3N4PPN3_9BACT|nr:hypothetical protein [Chitinophaga lutea]RPE09668.1 hypothetical protein EGT74_22070 [Chitinophaga lutea]